MRVSYGGVYCEDFRENWSCYNVTALYYISFIASWLIAQVANFAPVLNGNITCFTQWISTLDISNTLTGFGLVSSWLHFNNSAFASDVDDATWCIRMSLRYITQLLYKVVGDMQRFSSVSHWYNLSYDIMFDGSPQNNYSNIIAHEMLATAIRLSHKKWNI